MDTSGGVGGGVGGRALQGGRVLQDNEVCEVKDSFEPLNKVKDVFHIHSPLPLDTKTNT